MMRPMTVSELLARARSAQGKGTIYTLGGGVNNPKAANPKDVNGACDCSGYVCWALGMKRFQPDNPFYKGFNGGWVNTDSMFADANTAVGFFHKLPVPVVGALLVFPKQKGAVAGHVGIITGVDASTGKVLSVIHCSSGNFKKTKDAIQDTPPTVFTAPNTIAIWYEGLTLDGVTPAGNNS